MNWRDQEAEFQKTPKAIEANRRAMEIIAHGEREKREQQAMADGKLVEHVTLNPHTGAVWYRDWSGPKSAWMNQFKDPGVRVTKFIKDWPGGAPLSEMRTVTQDQMGRVVGEFDRRLVRLQEGKK
jgi:hypothetical protein